MNVIRVRYLPEFGSGDVVLLAADGAGIDTFLAALIEATLQGSSRLQHRERVHEFTVEVGAANVELGDESVHWRLDPAKATEIVEKLGVLSGNGGPGHLYVDDMLDPAPTLLLSRDEYLESSWLTAGREPIFSRDDEPQ